MTSETAIKASNISRVFRLYDSPVARLKEALSPTNKAYSKEFHALKDISFTLAVGESMGILGRNGAGKSTLLKIVTGVLSATSGEVDINGRVSSLLELGTGFDPELSGRDNLFLYGTLMGLDESEVLDRLQSIMDFADIGEFISQPVKTYSSGMFARLAFAAAINVTPDILIVDEVLSVGDAAFQKKCVAKIKELRENGVSLLLVSHDEYLVRQLCTKAIFLESGECRYYGDSETCLTEYAYSSSHKPDGMILENENENENENVVIQENEQSFIISIVSCETLNSAGETCQEFHSGEDISVQFSLEISGLFDDRLSFIVNLYTENGVYVFGTTTLMDGIAPTKVPENGKVKVTFKKAPILAGKYVIRVAVNDETGLCILREMNPAANITVKDDFSAVGLVNLEREWFL